MTMTRKTAHKQGFHAPRLGRRQAQTILDVLQSMRPLQTEAAPGYDRRVYAKDRIPTEWRVVELTASECSDFLARCEDAGISTADWGMEIPEERIPEGGSVKLNLEHIFTVADKSAAHRVKTSRAGASPGLTK